MSVPDGFRDDEWCFRFQGYSKGHPESFRGFPMQSRGFKGRYRVFQEVSGALGDFKRVLRMIKADSRDRMSVPGNFKGFLRHN